MEFQSGLPIRPYQNPMGFEYGDGVYGPTPEIRRLQDIRHVLADPDCQGPEELYCIAMDVAMEQDREALYSRNLLFGVVTYAAGRLGNEPVRSQGHIHAVSPSCGCSTPEVYEIWEGEAVIYMQESGGDNPGRCFAVHAAAGEVVIVPPGWVHATVNADAGSRMTFGAWCVRDYGFDYDDVKRHNGIAFFPTSTDDDRQLVWNRNPAYAGGSLAEKQARAYPEFGLEPQIPIYEQFQKDRERFNFVVNPQQYPEYWDGYQP